MSSMKITRAATFSAAAIALVGAAFAQSIAVDAVSGASGGRKMVTVSSIDVTSTGASISFSEGFRNGALRLYYSTTAFSGTADTTRATVTKMTVSVRGTGSVSLAGLQANTKYYYKFQGWYQKGVANYWASGSLTTLPAAGVRRILPSESGAASQAVDVRGRRSSGGPAVEFGANGGSPAIEGVRR